MAEALELVNLTNEQRNNLRKLLLGRMLVARGARARAWTAAAWATVGANLVVFGAWRTYDYQLHPGDDRSAGAFVWLAGTGLLLWLRRHFRRRSAECSEIMFGPSERFLSRARRRWWWLSGRWWIIGGGLALSFGASMASGQFDRDIATYVNDLHGTTFEESQEPQLRAANVDARAHEVGVNVGSALIAAGIGSIVAGCTAKRRQTRQLLGGAMLPIVAVAQGRRVSSESFADGLDAMLISYGHPNDRDSQVGRRVLGWGQIELAKNAYRLTEDPLLVGEFARTLLGVLDRAVWDRLPERIKDDTLDRLALGHAATISAFEHGSVWSLPAFWVPSYGVDARDRLIAVSEITAFLDDPSHSRAEVYDRLVELTGPDQRFEEAEGLYGSLDFSSFRRGGPHTSGRFPFDRRPPTIRLRLLRWIRVRPRAVELPACSAERNDATRRKPRPAPPLQHRRGTKRRRKR